MNLTPTFAREARSAVALSVRCARAGQGFDGRALERLADGSAAGPNMARRLSRGRANSSPRGFRVEYDDLPLEVFDRGSRHQPERRVIGLDAPTRAAITKRVAVAVAAQLNARLRRV